MTDPLPLVWERPKGYSTKNGPWGSPKPVSTEPLWRDRLKLQEDERKNYLNHVEKKGKAYRPHRPTKANASENAVVEQADSLGATDQKPSLESESVDHKISNKTALDKTLLSLPTSSDLPVGKAASKKAASSKVASSKAAPSKIPISKAASGNAAPNRVPLTTNPFSMAATGKATPSATPFNKAASNDISPSKTPFSILPTSKNPLSKSSDKRRADDVQTPIIDAEQAKRQRISLYTSARLSDQVYDQEDFKRGFQLPQDDSGRSDDDSSNDKKEGLEKREVIVVDLTEDDETEEANQECRDEEMVEETDHESKDEDGEDIARNETTTILDSQDGEDLMMLDSPDEEDVTMLDRDDSEPEATEFSAPSRPKPDGRGRVARAKPGIGPRTRGREARV